MGAQTAIALLSGGLDSAVALGLWLADDDRSVALALTFDYGQRSADAERRAAEALAARFGVAWRDVPLPWVADLAARAGSSLVAAGGELPRRTVDDPGDAQSAAAVWVPARNLVFLSIGAAFAEAYGAGVVLAGFNREEAETFPDNSEAFVDAMNRTLGHAARRPVRVASPTQFMAKPRIAAAAMRLGLRPTDVFSCYGAGPEPCGHCESCVRSARAWDPRN